MLYPADFIPTAPLHFHSRMARPGSLTIQWAELIAKIRQARSLG